jgi:hypothetical protein
MRQKCSGISYVHVPVSVGTNLSQGGYILLKVRIILSYLYVLVNA